MTGLPGSRHRAPHRPPATLTEAKAGLDRHRACADDCPAKCRYELAVREMLRRPSPGWNIWAPDTARPGD